MSKKLNDSLELEEDLFSDKENVQPNQGGHQQADPEDDIMETPSVSIDHEEEARQQDMDDGFILDDGAGDCRAEDYNRQDSEFDLVGAQQENQLEEKRCKVFKEHKEHKDEESRSDSEDDPSVVMYVNKAPEEKEEEQKDQQSEDNTEVLPDLPPTKTDPNWPGLPTPAEFAVMEPNFVAEAKKGNSVLQLAEDKPCDFTYQWSALWDNKGHPLSHEENHKLLRAMKDWKTKLVNDKKDHAKAKKPKPIAYWEMEPPQDR